MKEFEEEFTMAKKSVKEIIKAVEGAISVLEEVREFLGEGNTADGAKDSKKASKKAEPEDDEDEDGEDSDRREELEGMSYNELKALVKELGGKAIGKKPELIDIILELEGQEDDSEDDEDEDADSDEEGALTEDEAREQLEGLEKSDLKEIAEEMGVKVLAKDTAKKIIDKLVQDLDGLDKALEALGYYDEDEEDDSEDDEDGEDEGNSLVDDLDELSQEELATICADNGISAKGKKQALIDRLVEAVEKGDITEDDIFGDDEDAEDDDEAEDEEDMTVEELVDELDEDELKDLAKELGINIKKLKKVADIKKAILKKDDDDISEALEALGLVGEPDEDEDDEDDADEDGADSDEEDDSEDDEDEDEEENLSKEAKKAMDKIEKDIRAKYKAKKLKDATIKKFVNNYYDGDPDLSDLDKEEMLEEYIDIQKHLVDDDGEVHDMKEPYERNGENYCCGAKLVPGKGKKKGILICEVCGEEYKELEE